MSVKEIVQLVKGNLRRLLFDAAVFILLGVVLLTSFYEHFPNPIQLVMYDVFVRSVAILQAHISRKLLFPKVDWSADRITPLHILVILWYLLFLYTSK